MFYNEMELLVSEYYPTIILLSSSYHQYVHYGVASSKGLESGEDNLKHPSEISHQVIFHQATARYTYTARCGYHLLRLRFPAKTAQQRRPERVTVVHENVVVRAFGAHTVECQRYKLAIVARLNQPLAVRVLQYRERRGKNPGGVIQAVN